MKKTFLFIALVLASLQFAAGQNNTIKVKGTVTATDSGAPLTGVAVSVNNIYTETDYDGNWNLEVPKGSTVSFVLTGMKSTYVTVKEAGQYDVIMEEDVLKLEESVVVGYGTQRKKDLTGSITVVSGEEIKNSPSNNPLSTLQGKVPGLYVVNSGSADGLPSIMLRGVSTVRASTAPLYVVDNMLTDDISWLNINDIETMEVLKDASSTAMFGVQGANGVIIITTKKADG